VLVCLKFQNRFARPYLGEKGFGVEPVIGEVPHTSLLCSDERAAAYVCRWNLHRLTLFALCPIPDARQLVDTMKKILLATVAILAFAAPSFAQDKQDKTVGQAPPSGASSFYLAQDTATMKCQIVNAQPAAGGKMKVIGAAHSTQASADTALAAEKTCTK